MDDNEPPSLGRITVAVLVFLAIVLLAAICI